MASLSDEGSSEAEKKTYLYWQTRSLHLLRLGDVAQALGAFNVCGMFPEASASGAISVIKREPF